MTEKGYNGWTNYETWAYKLWMDNDRGEYDYWREETQGAWARARAEDHFTRSQAARYVLAEHLKSYAEDNQPPVDGAYGDLLSASIDRIDWPEIAHSLLDDLAEDADDGQDTYCGRDFRQSAASASATYEWRQALIPSVTGGDCQTASDRVK